MRIKKLEWCFKYFITISLTAFSGLSEAKTVLSTPMDLPVTYTVQEGDTLWSVAEKVYKNPFKWPLLERYDHKPFRNTDKIRNGLKLVAPNEKRHDRIKNAIRFACAYKEKKWKFRLGESAPGAPECFQDGKNKGIVETDDGRYFVLALDGVTVYGYDINYRPLDQMSIQTGDNDTFRAETIGFMPPKKETKIKNGNLILVDHSGTMRYFQVPMPGNFSPLEAH